MTSPLKILSYISLAIMLGLVTYFAALIFFTESSSTLGSTETFASSSLAELLSPDETTSLDELVAATKDISAKESLESVVNNRFAVDSGKRQTITLAGGCFWCTEAFIQETPGVVSAVSGYAEGSAATADYKTVSKGNTKHREAVQVVFDPIRIGVGDILEIYWSHIDPTDAGGQFSDRGHHYTTAIYYHDQNQEQLVTASKEALQDSGLFSENIITEILPYSTFFPAEEYHQDYYLKASAHYERYKKASGRADFIEDNWAKEAALLFFDSQEYKSSQQPSEIEKIEVYRPRTWSKNEIYTALAALPSDVYEIVVKARTEPRYNNKYVDFYGAGIYVDVVTGDPLFSSTHKFKSGTGWPAFYKPIDGALVILEEDFSLLIPRTEVRSSSGHLGHVFTDGPSEHGGKRYCINSLALDFISKSEMAERGYAEWLYLFE